MESLESAAVLELSQTKAQLPVGLRKKGSNNILMRKLFSRQPSATKMAANGAQAKTQEDLTSESEDDMLYRDLEITPCPYIRPNGFKLEPRVELYPVRPRVITAIETPAANVEGGEGTPNDSLTHRDLSLREEVVLAAAANPAHIQAWEKYLKYYTEGRFSIAMPPDPPPMKSSFTYLPATFPTNEAERLATLEMCNTEWCDWAVERARVLVCDAMKKFKAPWAAISIFDRDLEIIKAECGYHRRYIRRKESIAAHVLLTNDVMAILDTQTDWRFAGNPLVVGAPKIRFFAGAPLLSANSEVIGVFSIFSPDTRECFTAMERRELTDFAGMVMSDLTYLMDQQLTESQRNTPILERKELINRISPPDQVSVQHHERTASMDSSLTPTPLRYHKPSSDRRSKPRVIIDGQRSEPAPLDHTPPTSDDSDDGSSPSRVKGMARNFKQLTVDFSPTLDLQNELMTPDSSSFPLLLPRAFSGSDLTSVDHNRRCVTPEAWYDESAELKAVKTEDFVEHATLQDAPLFDNQYPDSPTIRDFNVNSDVGSSALFINGGEVSGEVERPQHIRNHFSSVGTDSTKCRSRYDSPNSCMETASIISKSTNITYPDELEHFNAEIDTVTDLPNFEFGIIHQSVTPSDTQVEADFAADFAARNLGFDCVYAASFTPSRPFMTDAQLAAEGGMIVRILASYGLPDDIGLNVPLHLSIIRGHGTKFWEDDKSLPGECGKGFMMRLKSSGGIQSQRSQGVIFGAFRNMPENGDPLPKVTITEFQRLRDAAMALKSILFKTSLRSHNRANTEPPTPDTAYSAQQEIELGKFSLDAGIERLMNRPEEPTVL